MKIQKNHFQIIFTLITLFILCACQKEDDCPEIHPTCNEDEITVTVYKHATYEGASQTFGIGVYFVSALSEVGDDQISSLRVSPKGCVKVTICENQDPQNFGICETYTTDQVFIDELNDKISYLKVELAEH